MASAVNGAKPINSNVATSPTTTNFMFAFPYLFPAPVIETSGYIFNSDYITVG